MYIILLSLLFSCKKNDSPCSNYRPKVIAKFDKTYIVIDSIQDYEFAIDREGERIYTNSRSIPNYNYGEGAVIWIKQKTCSREDSIYIDNGKYSTIIDARDGQVYKTIQIGEQHWMAENLRYSALNPQSPDSRYGRLYDWHTLMGGRDSSLSFPRGLCPQGWHVPSDKEWLELEVYLGMDSIISRKTGWRGQDEGYMLKSISDWLYNGNGLNSIGFNAYPTGGYSTIGFYGEGMTTDFWTSSSFSQTDVWYRSLYSHGGQIFRRINAKTDGLACRCVQDQI